MEIINRISSYDGRSMTSVRFSSPSWPENKVLEVSVGHDKGKGNYTSFQVFEVDGNFVRCELFNEKDFPSLRIYTDKEARFNKAKMIAACGDITRIKELMAFFCMKKGIVNDWA